MKLEAALILMRAGKKIRLPDMAKDEYYMGCYVGLIGGHHNFGNPDFFSIVLMKGDCEHPDFRGERRYSKSSRSIEFFNFHPNELMLDISYIPDNCKLNNKLHTVHHIDIRSLTRDDWEAFE